jgi:hypothetical protein
MSKLRFHGIDALRFFSFLAIVIFHVANAIFFEGAPYEDWQGTFFEWQQIFARVLPFSGFTIVAIHSFLFGFFPGQSERRRWLLLFLGSVILLMSYGSPLEGDFFWEWDIYQYLLFALLLLELLRIISPSAWLVGASSFLILCIPFWQWDFGLPQMLLHPLIGVCNGGSRGGWPLLPWLALPAFFFAWGRLQTRLPLRKWEGFFWLGCLLGSWPQWGAYFPVDTGAGFYCYIFRQGPLVFWSHLLWVLLLLRLAVQRPQWFRHLAFFSRWQINQRFGWAYLLHLLFVALLVEWGGVFREERGIFPFLPLAVFLATEGGLRIAQGISNYRITIRSN